MTNRRLMNEAVEKLARRAVEIIAPCFGREELFKEAYLEFAAAFREELAAYEEARELMLKRLCRTEPGCNHEDERNA